jgi:hypothetical protein
MVFLRALVAAMALCFCVHAATDLTEREVSLIRHVMRSTSNADARKSQLTPAILQLEGMSSPKVRHLLNNLAARPGTRYLELGVWKGSTLVSALYQNATTAPGAVAIDSWTAGDVQEACMRVCGQYLEPTAYRLYRADCFAIDPRQYIPQPINLFFYDADHSFESQLQALTHYDCVFDDLFVAVIDDWNDESVQDGTRAALELLDYQVLYEIELPARWNGDLENWWNGLYVAVIRKPH